MKQKKTENESPINLHKVPSFAFRTQPSFSKWPPVHRCTRPVQITVFHAYVVTMVASRLHGFSGVFGISISAGWSVQEGKI